MANDAQPFDLWRFVKKVRIEIVVFALILGAMCFTMQKEALIGLASLLSAKLLTLTVAVIFAHLMRIYGFPYLCLSDMIEKHHWAGVIFLMGWYCTVIYAVAVGG